MDAGLVGRILLYAAIATSAWGATASLLGFFFFFFPAGLVLYWLVNNILSILQQWQIQRMFNRDKPAHAKR